MSIFRERKKRVIKPFLEGDLLFACPLSGLDIQKSLLQIWEMSLFTPSALFGKWTKSSLDDRWSDIAIYNGNNHPFDYDSGEETLENTVTVYVGEYTALARSRLSRDASQVVDADHAHSYEVVAP